jgi:hypothetical protein
MDISEYYADRENCVKEIQLARKVFTNKDSTPEEWDGVQKALGFMYFYCPDDILPAVAANLEELHKRKSFLELAPDDS